MSEASFAHVHGQHFSSEFGLNAYSNNSRTWACTNPEAFRDNVIKNEMQVRVGFKSDEFVDIAFANSPQFFWTAFDIYFRGIAQESYLSEAKTDEFGHFRLEQFREGVSFVFGMSDVGRGSLVFEFWLGLVAIGGFVSQYPKLKQGLLEITKDAKYVSKSLPPAARAVLETKAKKSIGKKNGDHSDSTE